jgi:hypothetical protein
MGSIFANRITQTLTIPDTSETVTIRKLAPRHLEAASDAQMLKAMDRLGKLGGVNGLTALQKLQEKGGEKSAGGTHESDADKTADPMNGLDALTLIAKGVVSWTLDEPAEMAAFEELDEDTRDWLARAILRLTRPALFQSPDEREDATVKG